VSLLTVTKYTVLQKKGATKLMVVALSNLNGFGKKFHDWEEKEISDKNHTHHTLLMLRLLHYLWYLFWNTGVQLFLVSG